MSYGQVYLITNKLSGKAYVGQTIRTLEVRFAEHCKPTSVVRNVAISAALARYGREAFTLELIEECATQAALDQTEAYWIATLATMAPAGYNLREGGVGGAMSAEARAKLSAAHMGKVISVDHRRRISASLTGRTLSSATRAAIAQGLANMPDGVREARLQAVSRAMAGRRAADTAYANTGLREYFLVAPDGSPQTVTNMRQFCLENGYSISRMSELINGKRKTYRGWVRNEGYYTEDVPPHRKPRGRRLARLTRAGVPAPVAS